MATSPLPASPAQTGEEHLGEINQNIGASNGFDARLLGAIASGGRAGNLTAGRIDAFGAKGHFFFDLAVTPLRLSRDGRIRETALITEALVTYRQTDFDVRLGRQRIYNGPIQASLWGSMLRQGGRTTFDALRLHSRRSGSLSYDFAYLIDAYPRQFASDASGRQTGYYGRLENRTSNYAVGLNLLYLNDVPTPSTTGVTVDFVLPVARDQIELYGEVGRDPFQRRTETFGLSLPGIFEKTGIDFFLETANVRSKTTALAPNREIAVRAYRSLSPNWDLMVAANRFQGSNTRFIVGFTLGKSRDRQDALVERLSAR
jgi:hypothetical protein